MLVRLMKNTENNCQIPQTSGPLLKSTHIDQREKDTLSANHVAIKQYLNIATYQTE